MVAEFQELATQENQAKVVSPSMTALEIPECPGAIITCHMHLEAIYISPLGARVSTSCNKSLWAGRACSYLVNTIHLTISPCTGLDAVCSTVPGPHCW